RSTTPTSSPFGCQACPFCIVLLSFLIFCANSIPEIVTAALSNHLILVWTGFVASLSDGPAQFATPSPGTGACIARREIAGPVALASVIQHVRAVPRKAVARSGRSQQGS